MQVKLVAKISAFQQREKPEKMLSFYADLMLSYEYYWKMCRVSRPGFLTAVIVNTVENRHQFPQPQGGETGALAQLPAGDARHVLGAGVAVPPRQSS